MQLREMPVNHLRECRKVSLYVCKAQHRSVESQFVFIETTLELCKLVGNAERAVNNSNGQYILIRQSVQLHTSLMALISFQGSILVGHS